MSIDTLIINSPYEEPREHWEYVPETKSFVRRDGRRESGYVVATPNARTIDDPGQPRKIELVNQIRPRVNAWRENGYAGVTGITKRLLEHWHNTDAREDKRFFFCQLEAIETLIWLAESPASEKVGVEILSDGGEFPRLCSKMATGTGKTIVMAMLIAWHTLNKTTYPHNSLFTKNFFVIAPGLTVKSRLQVLIPSAQGNYYDEFDIVPTGLRDKLRQGKVVVRNWHALNWEDDEKLKKKKTVDKRGAKSDEAYTREVLGEMHTAKNFAVINDEAHHAWRVPADVKLKGVDKEDVEEATKWIGGLDRLHNARGILTAYDFSATPFIPSGKRSAEEDLFGWIVSDFGLNDAIESGLVKTPRVVVRDDGQLSSDYKSRFYHIYNDSEVKNSLNKKGAKETEGLPDLVQRAYKFLGADWRETLRTWRGEDEKRVPPVLITVANRTETAARIKYHFDKKRLEPLELCDPKRTLHIDSKVLAEAEARDEPLFAATIDRIESDDDDSTDAPRKRTKKDEAEWLRQQVDTIGQTGKPGEFIQHVISVGMLSEGWDAKNVTHIMGLRAFSSQLLCEQVVGRGLRRTSYDIDKTSGKFKPEYVNIFGVPFTFLPHESTEGTPPPPQSYKTRIEPLTEKHEFEIRFPNVLRVEHVFKPKLTLDMTRIELLKLSVYETSTYTELAPVLEGKPDFLRASDIDLIKLDGEKRLQRNIFEIVVSVFDEMKSQWRGNPNELFAQLVRLVEKFSDSDRLTFSPPLFGTDPVRRRILVRMNLNKIVNHIKREIKQENSETTALVFDSEKPIKSTSDLASWLTSKPTQSARKSHLNLVVCDSRWEGHAALTLDRNDNVQAWVKNDHLGFEIRYLFGGTEHRYRPDFIIRFQSGDYLVLETKGQETQADKAKRDALREWCEAVTNHGGFGLWHCAVAKHPDKLLEVLGTNSI